MAAAQNLLNHGGHVAWPLEQRTTTDGVTLESWAGLSNAFGFNLHWNEHKPSPKNLVRDDTYTRVLLSERADNFPEQVQNLCDKPGFDAIIGTPQYLTAIINTLSYLFLSEHNLL